MESITPACAFNNPDFEVSDKGYFLEIGQFGLGNFICLDHTQREGLLSIVDAVRGYIKRNKRHRPLNIYIEALPGTGKSFLVKQVCKSVLNIMPKSKLKFLSYNMTYVDSPEQLTGSFRRVQDSNLKGEIPVIFFDEVDSKIGGVKDSYPYFLTAMYDGTIYESGEEWKLGDAIFFFAASKRLRHLVNTEKKNISGLAGPSEKSPAKSLKHEDPIDYKVWIQKETQQYQDNIYPNIGKGEDEPKKLKDFLDRIDHFVRLPPAYVVPNNDLELALKEAHYIAASLILKHFPNITLIESEAIAILAWSIINSNSRRYVESQIFNACVSNSNTFLSCHLPKKFVENSEIQKKLLEIKSERKRLANGKKVKTKLIPIGERAPDL